MAQRPQPAGGRQAPASCSIRGDYHGNQRPAASSSTADPTKIQAVPVQRSRQNQNDAKRLSQAMQALGWKYKRSLRVGPGPTVVGYVSPHDSQQCSLDLG